ncbi:hypothetical protein M569_05649, partial [Genlisea aurea]
MSTEPPRLPAAPEVLEQINRLLERLLRLTSSVACFVFRWQVIRSKLVSLQSLISDAAEFPHWKENQLIPPLLALILSDLRRTEILWRDCHEDSVSRGKLLMQSDLDIAAGLLSKQINDLGMVLRSGVLDKPNRSSSKEELVFFVKDLFIRLQIGIGGPEFKRKAFDSLVNLLFNDEKSAAIVAEQGNVGYLVSQLDLSVDSSIRELAVVS